MEREKEREGEVKMYSWSRKETLGKGGFGFVSKAETREINSQEINNSLQESHQPFVTMQSTKSEKKSLPPVVAVKSTKAEPEQKKSLLVEKEMLDKFEECPCILHCFGHNESFENGERLYNIFLEYASGGSLADCVQSGHGMQEHLVRRYTKSMLTALSHIHKLGYVHCDVKPHNVLLVKEEDCSKSLRKNQHDERGDFVAKLADFGSVMRSTCVSGEFRGTVLYAAPESIARQEYVPESDIWALGCSVLYLLTGQSPWKIDKHKETVEDVLFKIGCSRELPEIPSEDRISKKARDFLRRCLIKDPRARCTADELLHHPFVEDKTSHHHHHHFSFRSLQSLVPHSCFHVRLSTAVHAC